MVINPYAGALADSDAAAVISETPGRLEAYLESKSAEEIEAAPAPGKWSLREVIAHLADCEIAFGFRLRQVAAGEKMIQPFDQGVWGERYAVYTMAQALETFRVLRAWNVAFVSGLTEADKPLPAMHPERGEMTLWTVVETMAGHDRHHLKLMGA